MYPTNCVKLRLKHFSAKQTLAVVASVANGLRLVQPHRCLFPASKAPCPASHWKSTIYVNYERCFAYMVDGRIVCVHNFALQTLLDRKMKDSSHFSKTWFLGMTSLVA